MNFITNFVNQVLSNRDKKIKEFKNGKKSLKSSNTFLNKNEKFDVGIFSKHEENERNLKENIMDEIENNEDKKVWSFQSDEINEKERKYQAQFESEKSLSNRITKELAWYLWNDTSLDLSLKQMNELEKDLNQKEEAFTKLSKIKKKKKEKIDFKQGSYKSLKLIFFHFIIGVLLIAFTLSYVQNQPAEKKFLLSSLVLWNNTFQQIVWKFGGVFTQNVDKNYIEKRWKLVLQLIEMESKIQMCLDVVSDEKERQELQKLLMKIQSFRQELASPQYISLKNFIKNYDQYNLYVYSLRKALDGLNCKK